MNIRNAIFLCLAALGYSLLPGAAFAADVRVDDAAPQALPEEVPREEGQPEEPETEGRDKCEQERADPTLTEGVQSGVFEYSCRAIRWFDSLFGASHDFR